jgi:Ca-activated chloride channel family protein
MWVAAAMVVAAGMVAGAGTAWGDGMIVPVREDMRVRGSWAVKYHRVEMLVRDQVAAVTIDQEFVNTGSAAMEVEYLFPVAPGAAIDSMTMVVGGEEMKGTIMAADEARKIYEDIVRKKKDPALLEYVGYGLYRTRAFPLEPGKPAHVVIHYNQVCKKDGDVVEVFYPLNTEKFSAKAIEEVAIKVDIRTKADITTVYSPTHEIKIDRHGGRNVVASYRVNGTIPASDFVVYYKARDEKIGATLLTYEPQRGRDGYFMLLASPNPTVAAHELMAKDVVLVLDRSGSMSESGKIGQAREALGFILKSLNTEDRFSIISFNDGVDTLFPHLVAANRENLDKAEDLVSRIEAAGGTDIHSALAQAMAVVNDTEGGTKERPAYVIFVTDGLPTVGKTDATVILADTTAANTRQARIFTLGVGYDVNVQLLDRLVGENRGLSDYVKPNEPLEAKISGLYAKIKNPVMTGLKLEIPGVTIREIYPRNLGDLFEGVQLVVVGRYDSGDAEKLSGRRATVTISGKCGDRERKYEYPVTFREAGVSPTDCFVERLWAVRRIGFLLDEIQLHGKTEEVVGEVIRLSRDYGIITPYTSFLADERTRIASEKEMRAEAKATSSFVFKSTGGVGQRDAMSRQSMNNAERPDAAAPAAPPVFLGATGGAVSGPVTTTGFGNSDQSKYEHGAHETFSTVQNVNNQALYRRGQMWVTPETAGLDLAKDAAQVKHVQRYSEEYFKLVGENSVSENQVLATQQPNEQLLVKFRGQAYLIE